MFPFGMVDIFICKLGLTALEAIDTQTLADPAPNVAITTLLMVPLGEVRTREQGVWTTQTPLTSWLSLKCKTATIGEDYECFLSGSGDTPSNAPLDTWLQIDVERQWNINKTGSIGVKEFTGTLQIREITKPSNIVSASVHLKAELI